MWEVLYEATGKEETIKNVFELVQLFFAFLTAKHEKLENWLENRLNAKNLESLIRIIAEVAQLNKFVLNNCLQSISLWRDKSKNELVKENVHMLNVDLTKSE